MARFEKLATTDAVPEDTIVLADIAGFAAGSRMHHTTLGRTTPVGSMGAAAAHTRTLQARFRSRSAGLLGLV